GHIAVVHDTALPAHLLIGGHAVDGTVYLDRVPNRLGNEVVGLLSVLGQQLGNVHKGILTGKLQVIGGPVGGEADVEVLACIDQVGHLLLVVRVGDDLVVDLHADLLTGVLVQLGNHLFGIRRNRVDGHVPG